jgi:DnaJ family protein A protein 2
MFRASSEKSLYDILGVSKSDSCATIKKAYLRLARVHHPDKGGDPEMFKQITQASDILSDETKRRIYDETGSTDEQMSSGGFPPGFPPGSFPFEFNINDLFGNMFGNPPPGPQKGPIRKGKKPATVVQTIPVTLEQFYLGHSVTIHINRQSFCTACDHTGAKSKETCRSCHGHGTLTQVVQIGPMEMRTVGPCTDCQTRGERILEICTTCSGTGFTADKKALTVKIPAGSRAEESFIFPEVCSDHPAYERPGDVQIMLQEDANDESYKRYKRVGDRMQHLQVSVSISLAESLMGCVVQLDGHPGYEDGLFLQIPAGSFSHDRYLIRGCGMPLPGQANQYGDLQVQIEVQVSPLQRKRFMEEGAPLLAPLFEEHVRKTESKEETIHTVQPY